ncbi:MAG: outer membrane protein assembly factor BamE [Pseudomonadales bacterium]|nr:outer membrane protein assembly factor BamE [Cellvibrionales bacterium]MBP8030174.1 outer membrane protein assembly factor BamE [Pseudomonadales bacterium]
MSILLHRPLVRLLLPALFLLGITACSFPGVYKLDVQQGNIITQEMVNQLKPGMTRRQVRYIMGTPLLIDSFNDDRWDYFYSLKNGESELAQERLTLFFIDDQLVNMQGNFRPEQAATRQSKAEAKTTTE